MFTFIAFGPRKIMMMLDVVSRKLCDTGGIERAKAAVTALLDTTSEEDVVALFMPQLPEEAGCLSKGFVRATPVSEKEKKTNSNMKLEIK